MTTQTVKLGNLPFSSPYYSIGKEECQNFYVENSISDASKVPYYYVSIPGLKIFVPKTSSKVCRGMFRTSNDRLFAVFGNLVQEILITGERVLRGTLTSYSGPVSMADNTYQLCLVDGEFGYIFDFAKTTFTKIDPETFPNGATRVVCIDSYFIANYPNSNKYVWSKLNDGTIWDPLDFATKEGQPDNIVSLEAHKNLLWVFGSWSTEIHYDTGDTATQVWQRYQSAIIDVGCQAPFSVARIEDNIFWVGSDKSGNIAIWSNDGMLPKKISTRGIEQLINANVGTAGVGNAIGFTYSQAGHVFYVIQFTNSNLTLCYDVVTGAWHRRSSIADRGDDAKWRARWSSFIWGKNLFADDNSDAIYLTDMEYYLNDLPEGGTRDIRRIRTTPILQSNQKRIRHNWVQFLFEQGVGTVVNAENGTGRNPLAELWISDDNGYSFGNRRTASLGQMGQTTFRTRWIGLGHSRNRCYKIVITEPVKLILVGCIADMTELSF